MVAREMNLPGSHSPARMRLLVVVLALAVMVAAGAAMAGAAHARQLHTWVANRGCVGRVRRPQNITLACGNGAVWITGIRYSAYGPGRPARAIGELHFRVCIPSCAAGYTRTVRAGLTLHIQRRCAGWWWYTRASITSPAPRLHHYTWDIRPFACG